MRRYGVTAAMTADNASPVWTTWNNRPSTQMPADGSWAVHTTTDQMIEGGPTERAGHEDQRSRRAISGPLTPVTSGLSRLSADRFTRSSGRMTGLDGTASQADRVSSYQPACTYGGDGCR
jgi:hypothetical protein